VAAAGRRAAAPNGAPQWAQNWLPERDVWRQLAQTISPDPAPQEEQNGPVRADPHEGQVRAAGLFGVVIASPSADQKR